MTPDPQLTEEFDRYLQTTGTIMWGGEGWDVTDPKERIQAAEWFSKVACEFEQWLEAQLETEVADAIERHESGVSTRRGPQPGAEGDPEGIGFDMAGYV